MADLPREEGVLVTLTATERGVVHRAPLIYAPGARLSPGVCVCGQFPAQKTTNPATCRRCIQIAVCYVCGGVATRWIGWRRRHPSRHLYTCEEHHRSKEDTHA